MNMRARAERMVGLLMVGLLLVTGCAASPFTKNETPGQHFDRVMKEFAAHCAKAKLKPNDTACDILKLRPADPLATEEGRFAHSIKIPNPVPADSGYKPGMSSQEYFEHLCKTEAGEFIYKTVENVEGIYMMRPRKEATDDELSHLYALEDPYISVTEAGNFENLLGVRLFLGPSRYQFLEQPEKTAGSSVATAGTYRRYVGYDGQKRQTLSVNDVSDLKSRYGYTWRGISRPHDRDLGIAGGELIILDLQTGDVLAVRRGYIRSGGVRNISGIWWLTGPICPAGKPKRSDFYSYDFLFAVLKPKQ